MISDYYIPTKDEFKAGFLAYEEHEKRDAMYKVTMYLVGVFWGNFKEMADGLGVLLLTWNRSFYQFGMFDFEKLETCLSDNWQLIESFQQRSIHSLTENDRKSIYSLFNNFYEALAIAYGKNKDRKSAVSVSKVLHPLAPDFFPLWDNKIASKYGCTISIDSNQAEKYFEFCLINKEMAETLEQFTEGSAKPILKLIDQYNYAKYTKNWV
jgi:hypothetical protein